VRKSLVGVDGVAGLAEVVGGLKTFVGLFADR
jgi:hypothetical protein